MSVVHHEIPNSNRTRALSASINGRQTQNRRYGLDCVSRFDVGPGDLWGGCKLILALLQVNEIFVRLRSAEFAITDSELSAIAAAEMIGLRKPRAAIGMPTVL